MWGGFVDLMTVVHLVDWDPMGSYVCVHAGSHIAQLFRKPIAWIGHEECGRRRGPYQSRALSYGGGCGEDHSGVG